jgi:hypothetical protein
MLGWKALADTVDAVYATMPDQQNTMVICDNYGETGAINYYRRNKNLVACSFHADYANWITYNEPIKNVILVKETYYDRDRQRLEEKPLFDTVYLAAQRINPYAREDTISIYVLRGAKTDISKRIKEEQTEELNSWR